MNVTRQIQMRGEECESARGRRVRIHLPPKPKASLQGFMDPCPGRPKCLLLRYWFGGRPHQAVYQDEEAVHLPRRQHVAACPLLGEDYKFAPTLQASLPVSVVSFHDVAVRGPGSRAGRRSMAPGDLPLLTQWNKCTLNRIAPFAGTASEGSVLLDAAAPLPAKGAAGATPRRARRPSTLVRRPGHQVASMASSAESALPLASSSAVVAHTDTALSRSCWWVVGAALGIAAASATVSWILVGETQRRSTTLKVKRHFGLSD
jgi:hypothetical protein